MRCASLAMIGVVFTSDRPAGISDNISRTFAVAPGASVTLSATIGDVTVAGWERPEVSVQVDRSGPTKGSLTRLPLDLAGSDSAVTIAAVQAEGGKDPALRCDIQVRMPHDAALYADVFEGSLNIENLRHEIAAHVRRGTLEARNVAGVVRLETGIGDIRVRAAMLDPGGLLRLRTFNGDAELHLARRPSAARILALALNGTITSDIPLTMQERAGPRFGGAIIGSGEPLLSIDTVNGNIELKIDGIRRPARVGRSGKPGS
jgi:hypothetical protein